MLASIGSLSIMCIDYISVKTTKNNIQLLNGYKIIIKLIAQFLDHTIYHRNKTHKIMLQHT